MTVESIDTLVIGGGQAGLAMSEHLGKQGTPHLVLERARIAERWRSERWDSLVANGPAWHDRFPGREFPDVGPDGFPSKHQVTAYFEDYARMIDCPLRCGVNVTALSRTAGSAGFDVATSEGPIKASSFELAGTVPYPPSTIADEAILLPVESLLVDSVDRLEAILSANEVELEQAQKMGLRRVRNRVRELRDMGRGEYQAVLHDGTELRLSRSRRAHLEQRLGLSL